MRAPKDNHGLSAIETEIMDRFDAGQRVVEIAVALNLGRRRVEAVIDMYREGRSDAWEAPVRRGSRDLLAAIRLLQTRTTP